MESLDYWMFKLSDLNREVAKGQVEKIKQSIEKIGYIKKAPILVNKDMFIIDWQHRFEACAELHLPIYYEIVDWEMEKIMIELNASQKNWALIDYIKHYAEQWKEWFIYFLEFQKKYNLSITWTLSIITDAKSPWKKIKGWEWCPIYDYSDLVAQMACRVEWHIPFSKSRTFLRALVRVYIRGGVEALEKLEENILIIPQQFNIRDYCIIFENIINKRRRTNKINLFWQMLGKWWVMLRGMNNEGMLRK